jgi:hypothetical protein
MESSPYWEAKNYSAGQEIPRLLWNQKVHCCVYKGPPLAPILSQMNLVHDFPPYFPETHSNYLPVYA